jgi:tetratricopeptide (TPR) repeat protein
MFKKSLCMKQTDEMCDTKNWAYSSLTAALSIVILGVVIYGNTLHVPWYFDDFGNIVRNPLIRDLSAAWHKITAQRGLAMLSFALNYHFHGLELPGYHVVNILIHLLTTFLVYLNLRRVFRCQPVLALLSALLFLCHPLQTQSVTYIVQRMTSLSGLFFFLSLYLYVRARELLVEGKYFVSAGHLLFYLFSLVSGAIAVYTKQNAAVLPLCILLFDRYFLPKQKQSRWWLVLYLLPYFAAPVWMALTQFVFPVINGTGIRVITSTTDPAKGLAIAKGSDSEYVLTYLVTEFSVLWLYIRLLFLPYGQVLDYQYPLVTSLITIKNAMAFFGLAGLVTAAAMFRKRLPLVSFGIFWFFIALSVESTIIPLDPAFEHRLYVPMFGFVVLVPQLLDWCCRNRAKIVTLFIMVVIYAVMTWFRNDLWSHEYEFYEDQYAKVPHSTRVMVCLSKSYIDMGRDQDAEALLRKVIKADPSVQWAYVNLSSILMRKQRMDEALEVMMQGLKTNPFSSELYNKLGAFYDLQGKPELALKTLSKAISISPEYAETYTNLGVVYAGLKRWSEAEKYYRLGISALYENPKAHYNLGVALYSLGRVSEAADAFRLALKFAPEDAEALFNLASVSIELGNRQEAMALLPRLRSRDHVLATRLEKELAKQ